MEKQGVFYAVSVGPGDPELLTRHACRVSSSGSPGPTLTA